MKKIERIKLLLWHVDHLSAKEIGDILGLWTTPYALLATLEHNGAITSEWEFPHGDYPRRRLYKLKR